MSRSPAPECIDDLPTFTSSERKWIETEGEISNLKTNAFFCCLFRIIFLNFQFSFLESISNHIFNS
jgi:hypothetical protein